ncbi:hypothetical protein RUND412_001312 [Rhizina undulata]
MSGGSLKDLLKTLNVALSAPLPLYPLPDDIVGVIESYLNKHVDNDDHDSQRLHDELLNLFASKVQNHPEKHATFLACFRLLRPAIFGVERLLKWWDLLVRPTLDTMGQAKAVVADARAIVLGVLAYEEEDDLTGEKAKASAVFTDKLFEVFLEKTKLLSSDRGAGFKEEQRQRFVSANVEAVLLAYGKRRPKIFMEKIDMFVVQKEYRLQILGLLCSFVRLQGPHLYQVLQTPLLDHILQCLENDTSTTVISLALTVLIMFMPHLCNSLAPYLSRLFVVYTRVLCWDKFGVVRLEEMKYAGTKEDYRPMAATPLSTVTKSENNSDPIAWQKLDSSFEIATSTTPDVSDFFTFLYGLYPINFLTFIREPYKFLERMKYKDLDQLDIEEETIRQRTDYYRQRHMLHPNFLTLTAETELSDQSRWMKVEPADVTAECICLVNNNFSLASGQQKGRGGMFKQALPEALIPTEDIPHENLLSSEEHEDLYAASRSNWRESQNTTLSQDSTQTLGEFSGILGRGQRGTQSRAESPVVNERDIKTPDSPTIPLALAATEEESRIQDMLDLQETLRASLQNNGSRTDLTLHHHHNHQLPPPPGPPPPGPPPGYGSVTASPRLEAYVHSLSNTHLPRSPALRPAPSDTQGTIAYLQREVMLLRNDLNFERHLKQQQLSHIGHLQRKHIKEYTAEAETQNLINTNKSLKAKLEEAKKAYNASRQEALKSKSQAKKWEADLSTKIRALREEQKAWRADEEATKQALQASREENDNLRKLLAETEAEGLRWKQKIMTMGTDMEEVEKLRVFVDHLSNKLKEFEEREEEFEIQKHREEAAISQVERMKARLRAREEESIVLKRGYESKIADLAARLSTAPQLPPSTSPTITPQFQNMLDNSLNLANNRLATLRKAHKELLTKFTDLEIRYIELSAAREVEALPGRHTQTQSEYSEASDTSSRHLEGGSPQSSYESAEFRGWSVPGGEEVQGMQISEHGATVRSRDSVPESLGGSAGSARTVTSSTSEERRRRIGVESGVRIRGRGES